MLYSKKERKKKKKKKNAGQAGGQPPGFTPFVSQHQVKTFDTLSITPAVRRKPFGLQPKLCYTFYYYHISKNIA
jgi:hypothetical protein